MGPQFLIEIRYSQIIASFYIVMTYSAGMPLLYLISMLQIYLMYWVDKYLCKLNLLLNCYLVLRFYRKPPRYGAEMAEVALSSM